MRCISCVILLALTFMMAGVFAVAQSPTQSVKNVNGYLVVATCGTLTTPFKAGQYAPATVDVNGQFCVNK